MNVSACHYTSPESFQPMYLYQLHAYSKIRTHIRTNIDTNSQSCFSQLQFIPSHFQKGPVGENPFPYIQ